MKRFVVDNCVDSTRDEAEKQIEPAEYFSKEIRQYLIQKGVITDEEAI